MQDGQEPPAAAGASLRTSGRRVRGPFSRWPRTADAVLAVVVYVVTVAITDGPGDTMIVRSFGEVPWFAHVLFALAATALWWRRRAPLEVAAIVLAVWFLLLPSGFVDIGWALMIALYSVGRHSDRDLLGELAVLVAAVAMVLYGLTADLDYSEMIAGVVFMTGAWMLGRSRRLRLERQAQDVREREAERRRVVAEERTRIARELHDVVAHRVSLMTVQAGAARAVADTDPAAADQAMAAVEDTGRVALDELRHLLGVLRPEVERGGRDPQPGLADLPRLIERVRATGLEVDLRVHDVPDGLPVAIELSAHRIVQEALTNVMKHAGEDARAEVHVRGTAGGLTVEIRDDGGHRRTGTTDPTNPTDPTGPTNPTGPARPGFGGGGGPGHGLVGMRERVTLLGGSLEVGPLPHGGFRVLAHLPVVARTTAAEATRA